MKRFLRPLGLFLIFFAALIASASLLGRIGPFGDIPTVREKWAYWQKHKDEFDTVFIGTSRTYRGIMPSVFDELTTASGCPTRTFNFGVDGMFSPEDAYVAERLLSSPPKRLRWVFLEVAAFMEEFDDRDPNSIRTVYWHDWPRTQQTMRAALWPKKKSVKWSRWFESKRGADTPAYLAATHFRLFLLRSLNVGRSTGILDRVTSYPRSPEYPIGPRKDGFLAMADDKAGREVAMEKYRKMLAERERKPARVETMNLYAHESIDRVAARVRALKATPVLVLAPTTGEIRGQPRPESGLAILDFCDPQMYPELYREEIRADHAHLTAQGAEILTRLLAAKFLELAKRDHSVVEHSSTSSR